MTNDQEIEQAIVDKGLVKAPRVPKEAVDAAVARIEYLVVQKPGDTNSTFVHAYLDGSFYLATGHSSCVSAENFNAEIGENIAMGKAEQAARDKLWELMGFQLWSERTGAGF